MNIQENLNLRGEVLVEAILEDGSKQVLVDDRNLIVLNGRNHLANAIKQGTANFISDIYFGSGGASTSNPANPLPVLPGEVVLNNPWPGLIKNTDYNFSLVDTSSAATPRVSFAITVPKDNTQLNLKSINEIALMLNTTPSATAFAIKRFATITKSSSLGLSITWTLYV